MKQGQAASFNERTLDRCVQDIKQFKYYSSDIGKVKGYLDLYEKRDADLQNLGALKLSDSEYARQRDEIDETFRNDWTNRFLSRYPEVASIIKRAAESYNAAREKVILTSDLLKKKSSYITFPPQLPSQTPSTTRPKTTIAPKSKSTSSASTSRPKNTTKKTLVRITCELHLSGITSNWSGPMYIYTTYKYWSDGSRTFGPSGSGYLNQLPPACL